MRKAIVFIAASLDGFIAGPGDNLQFLSAVEHPDQDYGYHKLIESIDTVIMGRKTFDAVRSLGHTHPHPEKELYVITQSMRKPESGIHFYSGAINGLVEELKDMEGGKNILIDGGARVINSLLSFRLIDELIISTIPILLGDGIRLFREGRPEQKLELLSSNSFETGLVQNHYKVIR